MEGQQRTIVINRDEKGYGLRVSGDNPVFVEVAKQDGPAWKAGIRSGDRIIKVNGTLVTKYNHQEVVQMIMQGGSHVQLTVASMTQEQFVAAQTASSLSQLANCAPLLSANGHQMLTSSISQPTTLHQANFIHQQFKTPTIQQTNAGQHGFAFNDHNSNLNNYLSSMQQQAAGNLPMNLASSISNHHGSGSHRSAKQHSMKLITPPMPPGEITLLEFEKGKALTIRKMIAQLYDELRVLKQQQSKSKPGDLAAKLGKEIKHKEEQIKKMEDKLASVTSETSVLAGRSAGASANTVSASGHSHSSGVSVPRYQMPMDPVTSEVALMGIDAMHTGSTVGNNGAVGVRQPPPAFGSTRRHQSAENLHSYSGSKSSTPGATNQKIGIMHSSSDAGHHLQHHLHHQQASIRSPDLAAPAKKSHSFGQYDSSGGSTEQQQTTSSSSNSGSGGNLQSLAKSSADQSAPGILEASTRQMHQLQRPCISVATNPLYSSSTERIISMESGDEDDETEAGLTDYDQLIGHQPNRSTSSVSSTSLNSTGTRTSLGQSDSNLQQQSTAGANQFPDTLDALLQGKNGRNLLQFLHFLLTQQLEINSVLFCILTDLFRRVCKKPQGVKAPPGQQPENYFTSQQQIRQWALEIYTTFLLPDSPLRLPGSIDKPNDPLQVELGNNISSIFDPYLIKCREQIQHHLSLYRQQFITGLSSSGDKPASGGELVRLLVADQNLDDHLKKTADGSATLLGQITVLLSYLMNNNNASSCGSSKLSTCIAQLTCFTSVLYHCYPDMLIQLNNGDLSKKKSMLINLPVPIFLSYNQHLSYTQQQHQAQQMANGGSGNGGSVINSPGSSVEISFGQIAGLNSSFANLQHLQQQQHKRHKSLPVSTNQQQQQHVHSQTQVASPSGASVANTGPTSTGGQLSSSSLAAGIPYHLSSSSQPTGNHHSSTTNSTSIASHGTSNQNGSQFASTANNSSPFSSASALSKSGTSSASIRNVFESYGHMFYTLSSTKTQYCAHCDQSIWGMYGWNCPQCSLIVHHWCLRQAAQERPCPGSLNSSNAICFEDGLHSTLVSQHSTDSFTSSSMSQLPTRGKRGHVRSTGGRFFENILKKTGLSSSSLGSTSQLPGLGWPSDSSCFDITSMDSILKHSPAVSSASSSSNEDLSTIGNPAALSPKNTSFTSQSNISSSSCGVGFSHSFGQLPSSTALIPRSESLKHKRRRSKRCYRKKSDPTSEQGSICASDIRPNPTVGGWTDSLNSLLTDSEPDDVSDEEQSDCDNGITEHRFGSEQRQKLLTAVESTAISDYNQHLPDQEYCTVDEGSFDNGRNDDTPVIKKSISSQFPPPPPLPPRNHLSASQLKQRRSQLMDRTHLSKRQNCIMELIETERSHCKTIKMLLYLFMIPIWYQNLFEKDEFFIIFGGLGELCSVHQKIYDRLKEKKDEYERMSTKVIADELQFPQQQHQKVGELQIGPVLEEIFTGELGYLLRAPTSSFCANFQIADKLLGNRLNKDGRVREAIAKIESEGSKKGRKLDLKGMLGCCFQRITKYPLLLEILAKETDAGSEEHAQINRALQASREILTYVNQSIRLIELQAKTEVDQSLKLDIDFRREKLILEDSFTMRFDKKQQLELLLVLCEENLYFLQKESKKLLLKSMSKVPKPVLRCKDLMARKNVIDNRAFYLISSKHLMVELVAENESKREKWIDHISRIGVKENARRPHEEIKMRDLTNPDNVNDATTDKFTNKENSFANFAGNEFDLSRSKPEPRFDGKITMVESDTLTELKHYESDVLETRTPTQISQRLKVINMEIERLKQEEQYLLRQQSTMDHTNAIGHQFGQLSLDESNSSEQNLIKFSENKATQTDDY